MGPWSGGELMGWLAAAAVGSGPAPNGGAAPSIALQHALGGSARVPMPIACAAAAGSHVAQLACRASVASQGLPLN